MSTTTSFNLKRFVEAIEDRDAAAQLSAYSPEATVTIIDRISQPSTPRVCRTPEEIRAWLLDLTGRDMTHRVQQSVADESGAALIVGCRYPDGEQVVCATVVDLDGGLITRQTVVQVWEEQQ